MVFKAMLDLLRDNKQLPYYAAERRIDLFINIFLEHILTAFYNRKVNFVAPEFPLKLESNNQADKLDYLCAFEETKQPIFVELKTDVISFRSKQAKFYCEQSECWPACVEGLKEIIRSRGMRFSYREKYFQLIKRLLEKGLVVGEGADTSIQELEDNRNLIRKKTDFSRGLINLAKSIKAPWAGKARILYLVPNNDDFWKQIQCVCRRDCPREDCILDKDCILDFAGIEKLKTESDMSYAIEFQQLIEFLKTLK